MSRVFIGAGKTRWTYEDYLNCPNDGKQYQIIDGELFMTPAPAEAGEKGSCEQVGFR